MPRWLETSCGSRLSSSALGPPSPLLAPGQAATTPLHINERRGRHRASLAPTTPSAPSVARWPNTGQQLRARLSAPPGARARRPTRRQRWRGRLSAPPRPKREAPHDAPLSARATQSPTRGKARRPTRRQHRRGRLGAAPGGTARRPTRCENRGCAISPPTPTMASREWPIGSVVPRQRTAR